MLAELALIIDTSANMGKMHPSCLLPSGGNGSPHPNRSLEAMRSTATRVPCGAFPATLAAPGPCMLVARRGGAPPAACLCAGPGCPALGHLLASEGQRDLPRGHPVPCLNTRPVRAEQSSATQWSRAYSCWDPEGDIQSRCAQKECAHRSLASAASLAPLLQRQN